MKYIDKKLIKSLTIALALPTTIIISVIFFIELKNKGIVTPALSYFGIILMVSVPLFLMVVYGTKK